MTPWVPVLISLLTATMWMLDRTGWVMTRKRPFRLSGTWVGWSVFRESPLDRLSMHRDDEHYFKITLEIKQTYRRVRITEIIGEIYNVQGGRITDKSGRTFKGYGDLLNGSNLTMIFDEDIGLTCGVALLSVDTWGKKLNGGMVVRNVDGKPVLAELSLVRSPDAPPTIEQMVALEGLRLGVWSETSGHAISSSTGLQNDD